jgi:imidazole glycerol-phosphate synthase subunit HisH
MKRAEVVVPNYGCGNLASIQRICEKIGHSCQIVDHPEEMSGAARVILSGVGAFDHGIGRLRDRGFVEPLIERLRSGAPVLGICLGMQLLCRSSAEGELPGLNLVPADVRRFQFEPDVRLKVPHMGWSDLTIARDNPLLPIAGGAQRFYFAHSYHVVCDDPGDVIAEARYGYPVVAAFGRDNLFGVQFHPEKSHRFGMALLERFFGV